ncbi:HNH endonuclease [Halosimplex salinum]|uniref:HNH endonuclease n=1 Tax=Halosimplex salinum TaxID=1710538 RepID=UPI000F46B8BA
MTDSQSEDTTCPTCGKDDFSSRGYMKRHHTRVHGESIAGVELTCANCGDTYREKPNRVERSSFCSVECHNEFRSNNWTGEKAPNWKGGEVTLNCEQCGDEYKLIPAEAERGSRFCSIACKATHMRESGQWRKENNPRWTGGERPKYNGNWVYARKQARERDSFECQLCGVHESEFERELDVHHIIRVADFDDPQQAHTLENLVTLCRSCHITVEDIDIRELVKWDGSLDPQVLGHARREYRAFTRKMLEKGQTRTAFRDHVRGDN